MTPTVKLLRHLGVKYATLKATLEIKYTNLKSKQYTDPKSRYSIINNYFLCHHIYTDYVYRYVKVQAYTHIKYIYTGNITVQLMLQCI